MPSGFVPLERLLPKPDYVRLIDTEYRSGGLLAQILDNLAELDEPQR